MTDMTREQLKKILDDSSNEITKLQGDKIRLQTQSDQIRSRVDELTPVIKEKFGDLGFDALKSKQTELFSQLNELLGVQSQPTSSIDEDL